MARRTSSKALAANLLLLLLLCTDGVVVPSEAIGSPRYEVVHSESDFEVRYYQDSTWMASTVCDISFQKATLLGFHRLFQYIQGANLNFSRIRMTSPVVTSIIPGAGPFHSSAYSVRFYLPLKFQSDPPVPLPELHLKPYEWDSHCVAVRRFSGFATDDNIVKEAEKLSASLRSSPWAEFTGSDYAYSIAQYDHPFKFIGRVNEVWVDVEAVKSGGCVFNGTAAY